MNDTQTLSTRVELLETRVAYQDRTIEELNKSVTLQWKQIDDFARQIEQMMARLQDAEGSKLSGGSEPPPPHY
jgi:SlyX protein